MRVEVPTKITIAGLIATIAAVVAAVEPVLPSGTPQWARTAIAIAAVVAAALLRSPIVDGARDGSRPRKPRTIVLPPRDGGA